MKTNNIILGCTIATALVLSGWAISASGQTVHIINPGPVSKLTRRQRVWMNALEWCESKSVEDAVNPNDRDNTPSYGVLEFKPGTYEAYAKIIGLASTTDYMNPDGQRKILEYMVLDPTTKWLRQFPDCVKNKVGFPPKN